MYKCGKDALDAAYASDMVNQRDHCTPEAMYTMNSCTQCSTKTRDIAYNGHRRLNLYILQGATVNFHLSCSVACAATLG